MAWLALSTVAALVVYMWCTGRVGAARVKYEIDAPRTTGNETFERMYRVQQNTIEQLVVFLPALWLFGQFWSPIIAAVIAAIFIVGRILYAISYVAEPSKRTVGFLAGFLANVVLVVGSLIGAIRALL